MKEPKTKVLVVDDTEATRYAIVRTLRGEGFETVEASTGLQALEMATEDRPDLITLDIHLPDLLGFEVCRRIKSNPLTARIPVLQVSASYVTAKDRIHGLEGGADSYLTHPFEPAVLIATVKALLRTRRLNEDLRLSEEKFRVALKNAPMTIYTMDLGLRLTWIYNAPEGVDGAKLVHRDAADFFPTGEWRAVLESKRQVIASGQGQRLTAALPLQGEERFYDFTIEPLTGDAGRIEGLTVSAIDVTDRRRSEDLQRRAMEEAELANQAKTRFLSNMSHEIRTPLGVIQGFADLALDARISATERDSYLLTIKRNAQNLTKLLGEILDLSKVEAGRVEIENVRFSVRRLLAEIIDAYGLQAREKGINLSLRISEPFPDMVVTDPTRLRQILINMLSNAIKFTERGGVEIQAFISPKSEASASTMIEFQIRDTGLGLSLDQQQRLFQPFMQADNSTTRRFGGTGLGLNLSKKLAKALGGDLTLISSEPGLGSVFSLTLNAGVISRQNSAEPQPEPAREESQLATASEGALTGLHVLLAEDSTDNQMLFSRYLRNAGVSVELACDGLEAIEKAAQSRFDAILMDVQMPNLDGYEATKRLRENGFPGPIIALTANALKEDREKALTEGFTGYLTKPLNPKMLVEMLQQTRDAVAIVRDQAAQLPPGKPRV